MSGCSFGRYNGRLSAGSLPSHLIASFPCCHTLRMHSPVHAITAFTLAALLWIFRISRPLFNGLPLRGLPPVLSTLGLYEYVASVSRCTFPSAYHCRTVGHFPTPLLLCFFRIPPFCPRALCRFSLPYGLAMVVTSMSTTTVLQRCLE